MKSLLTIFSIFVFENFLPLYIPHSQVMFKFPKKNIRNQHISNNLTKMSELALAQLNNTYSMYDLTSRQLNNTY